MNRQPIVYAAVALSDTLAHKPAPGLVYSSQNYLKIANKGSGNLYDMDEPSASRMASSNLHALPLRTMKLQAVLLAFAAMFSVASTAPAEPPTRAEKNAQIAALLQDKETARYAVQEMLKDPEKKRFMAQALAHDADGRKFYQAEVGNDAPHEERNPSENPELFQPKKP